MQHYCLVIPRSLEECIAILHGLTSCWTLRYWDAELPTHYLLTCEQYDEVLACFVAAGVEEKMIQIVQDLAATIAMATAHGIVTAQARRVDLRVAREGRAVQGTREAPAPPAPSHFVRGRARLGALRQEVAHRVEAAKRQGARFDAPDGGRLGPGPGRRQRGEQEVTAR